MLGFKISNKQLIVIIVFGLIILSLVVNNKDQQYQVVSEVSSKTLEIENDEIYVQITGAVKSPGLYQMSSGDRINDALIAAGADDYNSECLNLAQKLVDEQNIYIPAKNQECEVKSGYQDGIVNINVANSLELQTIKGIGEAKANAIIEYRQMNGTFETKDQLLEVEGISEGLLSSIQDTISLS